MNQSISLEGKTYISSRRATEITRYSNDYVGQLCREGKVNARRVGRMWFVEEASLLEHKKNSNEDLQNYYRTLKSDVGREYRTDGHGYSHDVSALPVSTFTYSHDPRPLLPELKKNKPNDEAVSRIGGLPIGGKQKRKLSDYIGADHIGAPTRTNFRRNVGHGVRGFTGFIPPMLNAVAVALLFVAFLQLNDVVVTHYRNVPIVESLNSFESWAMKPLASLAHDTRAIARPLVNSMSDVGNKAHDKLVLMSDAVRGYSLRILSSVSVNFNSRSGSHDPLLASITDAISSTWESFTGLMRKGVIALFGIDEAVPTVVVIPPEDFGAGPSETATPATTVVAKTIPTYVPPAPVQQNALTTTIIRERVVEQPQNFTITQIDPTLLARIADVENRLQAFQDYTVLQRSHEADSTGRVIADVFSRAGGSSGGGSGTVTSVATNNGLTGGTFTTSGTIGLDTTSLVTNALTAWNGSVLSATGTPALTVGYLIATSTTASIFPYASTTMITSATASTTNFFGASLVDCDDPINSKLLWSDTGLFSCGSDQTGAGGTVDGSGFAGLMASWVDGNTLKSTSTIVAELYHATGTTASRFPYASTTAISVSGLTSGRVTYATTGGLLADDADLTFDGTTLTASTLNLSNALGIAYGGTNQTTFITGMPIWFDGTRLAATSSTFTVGSLISTSTSATSTFAGPLSIGSTTPGASSLFSVGTSTPDFVVNKNSGHVGIGTTGDSYFMLDVQGNSAGADVSARFKNANSTGWASNAFFNDTNADMWVGIGGSGLFSSQHDAYKNRGFLYANSSTGGLSLITQHSADDIRFYLGGTTASDEKMRIVSSGNVGIGTTSPYAKLSVVGEVVASHFTATSTTATSTFLGVLSVGSTTPTGEAQVSFGTTTETALIQSKTSGYWGIGTTTPGSLFSIGGIANFTSATSSFYGNGINLTAGCFAVNGTCVSGGGSGSGTVSSGIEGQLAWYSSSGTTVSGTSTWPLTVGSIIATTTTASILPYASTTAVSVSGLTSGRVTYATTGGLLADDADLTFDGTTLTASTLNLTNALGIAYGGTNQTSFIANMPIWFDGTRLAATSSTFTVGSLIATSTIASILPYASTTMLTAATASTSNFFGANLTDCDDPTNSKLLWSNTGLFSCGSDQTGAGGTVDGSGFAGLMASWVDGNTLQATSTIVAELYHATGTVASRFPYASTTAISAVTASTTNLTVSGLSTSTFSGGIQTSAINVTQTGATSTFANGITLSNGCFAVNGVCVGTNTGTVTSVATGNGLTGGPITNSGTISVDSTNLVTNALTTWNGTNFVATGTPSLTVGYLIATSTTASVIPYASTTAISVSGLTSGRVTYATTGGLLTDDADLTFDGTTLTVSTLNLTNALGIAYGGTNQTTFITGMPIWFDGTRLAATSSTFTVGSLISTSTSATSTFAAGIQATYLNLTGSSATSTAANGINLTAGCFAINGTCVGGGGGEGSGTVNSGTQGHVAFYNSSGTAVSGTSTIFIAQNTNVGISTSSPFAKFGIHANTNELVNTRLFEIASSTATATTTLLTFTNTGFLGLGTTSPYAVLSVVGASGIVADNINATNTAATSTLAGGVTIGGGLLNYDYYTGITSISSLQVGGALSFETDAGLVSWANLPISSAAVGTPEGYTAFLADNPAISVYGLSNGSGALSSDFPRVGIGSTTAPSSRLTVFGAGTATEGVFEIANSASSTILKILNNGTFSYPNVATSTVKDGQDNVWSIATSTSNTPLFSVSTRSSAFGMIGIGTTTPWRTLSATGTVALAGLSVATGGTNNDVCINSTTKELVEDTSGACVVSSERFKHDIQDLEGAGLSLVNALRPVSFAYNGREETRFGFIAEEVEKLDPRLVFYETGSTTPRGVYYDSFAPVLTKAIQEQQQEIAALKSSSASTTTTTTSSQTIVNNISSVYEGPSEELIAAIASSSAASAVSAFMASTTMTETLVSSIADRLASSTPAFVTRIADAVKSMIASAGEWIVDKLSARIVYTERIETQTAAISKGLELIDQVTGQVWCATIRNGEWDKKLGSCSAIAATTTPPTNTPAVNTGTSTLSSPNTTGNVTDNINATTTVGSTTINSVTTDSATTTSNVTTSTSTTTGNTATTAATASTTETVSTGTPSSGEGDNNGSSNPDVTVEPINTSNTSVMTESEASPDQGQVSPDTGSEAGNAPETDTGGPSTDTSAQETPPSETSGDTPASTETSNEPPVGG